MKAIMVQGKKDIEERLFNYGSYDHQKRQPGTGLFP